MNNDPEDMDWKDILLAFRMLWNYASWARWWLFGLGVGTYFLLLSPDDWQQPRMIALLFIAGLICFSRIASPPRD